MIARNEELKAEDSVNNEALSSLLEKCSNTEIGGTIQQPSDTAISKLNKESIALIAVSNPKNLCLKHLNQMMITEALNGLSDLGMERLLQCVKTGLENPDSEIGCYAMNAVRYNFLTPFIVTCRLS
jgi:hypothetical protein